MNQFHSDMYYAKSWLMGFYLLAIILAVLDRWLATIIYGWTHEKVSGSSAPPTKIKGLIYGRRAWTWFVHGIILSTLQTVFITPFVLTTLRNPAVELVLWVLEIFIVMVGYLTAKVVYRFGGPFICWTFRITEKVDTGELHVTETVEEQVEQAKSWFGRLVAKIKGLKKTKPSVISVPPPAPKPKPSAADIERDIKNYTGGL